MGSCLSCLGYRRSDQGQDQPTDSETSRLLYEDPYRSQYGSTVHRHQLDVEAQRKEREALEGLCHSMSEEVVDVFTVLPQTPNGVGSRVQSVDQLQLDPSASTNRNEQASTQSCTQVAKSEVEERQPMPQEIAYRSIKKTRNISTALNRDESEAAKAAIG